MSCNECKKLNTLLKQIINALADYDIVHTEFPLNLLREYQKKDMIRGLAVDDMKRIYIDKNACSSERREAVIHELLHIFNYQSGELDNVSTAEEENHVIRKTKEVKDLLYSQKGKKK